MRKHRKRAKLSQRSFLIIFPAQKKDSEMRAGIMRLMEQNKQGAVVDHAHACNKAALLSVLFFPTRADARAAPCH